MDDTTKPATMREIFEMVKANTRLMLEPWAWDLWIAGLTPVSYGQGVLVVAAPNETARTWCETRLDRVIRRELRRSAEREITVQYVLQNGGAPC